jgi:2-polyprenyl-6-hydroxyphenyl methylase / 3-demethylubiquinone-9 3-methyltransferase
MSRNPVKKDPTERGRMDGTVDPAEVARFEAIARTWWDPRGPMRTLHKFNPVRLSFIRDEVARHFDRDPLQEGCLDGLSLIDVGCGGGVLSEPLARMGATVTGLDPAPTNIEVARLHAERSGVEVDYRGQRIEDVVAAGERYDIVIAMEVVEHVADVDAFVAACCKAVKPGGLLFMATINRTMRAYALAIVGAEFILGWLPRGTHQWDRFVTPSELEGAIADGGLSVVETTGVVYNPLADKWSLSRDTGVNYMVFAARGAG